MGYLKQRKGPKAKAATSGAASASSETPAKPESSPRSVLRDLALITCVIGLPYLLYTSYLWVHLESGLLRPAVGAGEARQLLIVGSQSSGTSQTTVTLAKLGLEIAHEASDATTSFARDGTVSWFHGIRFLAGSAPEASLELLCARPHRNMGFHPAAFRRSSCSYRKTWDACWEAECRAIIAAEWGCAVTPGRACETPFDKSLLQARHPLRTMESLVVKYCKSESAPANPALTLFSLALLPSHEWDGARCLPVVAWYVLLYYEAMVQALDAGHMDGVYNIESTGVCDVARMGGFAEAKHAPSRDAYARACLGEGGRPPVELSDNVRNRRNQGLVELGLGNLTAIDPKLAKRVAALGKRLGYTIA
jgi:hypothetical protein